MTVRDKRKPKPRVPEMAVTRDAMAVPASEVHARERTEAGSAIGAALLLAVISAKTGVPVWVMPLSAHNEKPWSVPKCRCANWQLKPMAKPSPV